jgi:SWIM/SEC-C metal-binding protein
MPKLGSARKPIVVRVQTEKRAQEVASTCHQHGWHYIIGLEPDKSEDISDLNRALNPPTPIIATATPNRNSPCPCGSGKKYKKCCGAKL